jgi:hypothetical protein
MPTPISKLPVVNLDYTKRGPGLHVGMTGLEKLLEAEKGREGFLLINVAVSGAVVPIILARADLYVVGFRCGASWYRFEDAAWPFSDAVTALSHDGQYSSLGGLKGNLTQGSIDGVAGLASLAERAQWRESLRTLIVIVSECARLIPVRMYILGLLNGISHTVPLEPLAHYIQNWSKASKGTDMSKEVSPHFRTGFSDPTILKTVAKK